MSGNNQNISVQDECECLEVRRKYNPPPRNITHPLRYYEFTQDEIRALEECDAESFYQRCLPLSTLFASVTYAAIKGGSMRRSPHFGVFPKVFIAILLGHILGRLSYIPSCDLKLRTDLSPNSHLGTTMRNYYLEKNPPPKK